MTSDGPSFQTPSPLGPRRNIVVGTCSWTDESLIKVGTFYPRGTNTSEGRLRYYASQFPVVEVDSSYYAMPSARNAALWVERTPRAFRFNVKAFRLFTGHQTATDAFPPDLRDRLPVLERGAKNQYHYYADVPQDVRLEMWRRFIEAIAPLHHAGKLVAVHFQFAPHVSATKAWIAHIEHCVERMQGFRVAIEFRNKSWLAEDRAEKTLAWLRDLAAVHVVVDEPQGVGNYAQGVWEVANPELAIVRLHGRNADTWNAKGLTASSDRFDYEYSEQELTELSGRIVNLADKAFVVQVLVNVNYEDQGIEAARRLERLLGRLPDPDSIGKPAHGLAAASGQTGDLFDSKPEPAARPARKTRATRPKPDKAAEPDDDPTASLF